jgi:hypothetical protein
MPVLHFHVPVAQVKVPGPHFFLILRTAKVIAGHFNLAWRTVALAPRSLFSDCATLKSAYSSLSIDRPTLSRIHGFSYGTVLATVGGGNDQRAQADERHVVGRDTSAEVALHRVGPATPARRYPDR